MPKLSRNLQYMLGAVMLLALLALWRPGTGPEIPEQAPITELKSDAIHHLQLERPDRETLNFALGEHGWLMEAPYQLAAHDFAVKTLAGLVSAHSERQFPVEPAQLSSYGLETPLARLVINNILVIEVGGQEKLSRQRYLKVNDQVFLVTDTWQRILNANTEDFIHLMLLPEAAVITAIELPGLKLVKQGEEWQLTPVREHSLDQVQFLLDNWNYQQANTVQPYRGDDSGKDRVRIQLQGQAAIEFLVVNRNPLILARPDLGIQYVLATGMTSELLQLPALPSAGDLVDPGQQ